MKIYMMVAQSGVGEVTNMISILRSDIMSLSRSRFYTYEAFCSNCPLNGVIQEKNVGELHFEDGWIHSKQVPAVVVDGRMYWFKYGQLHRDDGPAVEWPNGDRKWYKNGQLHRDDGPALEGATGNKYWYKNGQRHREDGPATESANNYREWYKNGQRHREDGPAIELSNGDRYWYKNDQLYREDGPAVEMANGDRYWNGRYSDDQRR